MGNRDKYGHYVNDEEVTIKPSRDSKGNSHLSFYGGDVDIVDYCVEEIEKGNYEEAYTRYKESILTLEETFARPVLEQNLVKTLKTGRR